MYTRKVIMNKICNWVYRNLRAWFDCALCSAATNASNHTLRRLTNRRWKNEKKKREKKERKKRKEQYAPVDYHQAWNRFFYVVGQKYFIGIAFKRFFCLFFGIFVGIWVTIKLFNNTVSKMNILFKGILF